MSFSVEVRESWYRRSERASEPSEREKSLRSEGENRHIQKSNLHTEQTEHCFLTRTDKKKRTVAQGLSQNRCTKDQRENIWKRVSIAQSISKKDNRQKREEQFHTALSPSDRYTDSAPRDRACLSRAQCSAWVTNSNNTVYMGNERRSVRELCRELMSFKWPLNSRSRRGLE